MPELPDIQVYLHALDQRLAGRLRRRAAGAAGLAALDRGGLEPLAAERPVYAANECDYCPRCQTGGRLLADRSLARLLRKDWPRTLEELELRRGRTS